MKKTTVLILCLALAGLACLESVPSVGVIAPSVMPQNTIVAAATIAVAASTSTALSTDDGERCARVIAETAENLRVEPGLTGRIVGHLRSGEVVQVVNKFDSAWWLIERYGQVYYARSIYLQDVGCEEIKP